MCLRQVLVVGAFALAEIGHRIEAESIDATVSQRFITCSMAFTTRGSSKFKSGWWQKAVPVESVRFGIPCPVDFSLSVKMMRVPEYFWSVSLIRTSARAGPAGCAWRV